jgi:hypothetical protein
MRAKMADQFADMIRTSSNHPQWPRRKPPHPTHGTETNQSKLGTENII